MKGRAVILALIAVCVAISSRCAFAQMPAASPNPQTNEKPSTMGAQRAGASITFADAVKNYHFNLQKDEHDHEDFKLERTIKAPSLSTSDNLKIDYQIGTIDDKPAFVSVIVDRNKAPKGRKLKGDELRMAETTLGVTDSVTAKVGHLAKEVVVQKCSDGKRCVKTDKDGNCIKWVCEK